MSPEHAAAVEVLRRYLDGHREVLDVLDLTALGVGEPGGRTSRVAFTTSAGVEGGVGHVLVETDKWVSEFTIAGHVVPIDPNGPFDPLMLALEGGSNADLVVFHALAARNSGLIAALLREIRRLRRSEPYALGAPSLLTLHAALETSARFARYSAALRDLSSGAPIEWVARRFVDAPRTEGDS